MASFRASNTKQFAGESTVEHGTDKTGKKSAGFSARPTDAGMVSVEWALTAPVFIVLVLVLIAAIVHMNDASITSNAAREAARSYALGSSKEKALNVVQSLAGADSQAHITEEEGYVKVKVTKAAPPILHQLGLDVSSEHLMLIEPGARK